jgi:hypothetical protein
MNTIEVEQKLTVGTGGRSQKLSLHPSDQLCCDGILMPSAVPEASPRGFLCRFTLLPKRKRAAAFRNRPFGLQP